MVQVRTIKRYANRKLYDTQQSAYVTLEEIADFIRNGEEVRIVDNKTKEDLTAVTLTQIIFEQEKRQRRSLPLATLRNIIQSGGEFLHRRIAEPVTTFAEEAERTVGQWREEAERTVSRLVKIEGLEETRVLLKDFIENTIGTYEEVQKRVDERLRVVLSNLPNLSAMMSDLDALKEKVNGLEAALRKRSARGEDKDPAATPTGAHGKNA